jgi:molybdenum cofactor sulfurtransferase
MKRFYPGITFEDFENIVGRELGVVRIGLELFSDFSVVRRALRFAREVVVCGDKRKRV